MSRAPTFGWLLLFAGAVAWATGCSSAPPSEPDNICSILKDRPAWYRAAAKSESRWGTPIPIQFAFVARESSFERRARPPRRRILGLIPGSRPSSAYGYAQATTPTWDAYREATGKRFADRDDFGDAVDFIGWYNAQTKRRNGIALTNARHLYYAYHEGWGGYARGSFRKKRSVQSYAAKVEQRAARYSRQFDGCKQRFKRRRLFFN
ncbi:MAG: hypothetical protein AAF515_02665 [Pseudomonadota bacterium]